MTHSENVSELLFDIIAERATDEQLEKLATELKAWTDVNRVTRRQPVAYNFLEAMREAVAYRTGGHDEYEFNQDRDLMSRMPRG